jgi:hypothetical protein
MLVFIKQLLVNQYILKHSTRCSLLWLRGSEKILRYPTLLIDKQLNVSTGNILQQTSVKITIQINKEENVLLSVIFNQVSKDETVF